jgi:dTDP-4-dehydrorhamnose reductase
VLRVGVLYGGDQESLDESAITGLLKTARASVGAGVPVAVDNWASRYPIHVDDVSAVIHSLCLRKKSFCAFFGTFHLCGAERVTKFDMAKLFAKLDGVEPNLVPNDSEPSGAKRPKDARLDCRALQLMDCLSRRKLADGFAEVVRAFPRSN